MQVRTISGHAIYDLTSPLSAEAATHQLLTDGAIVILQRANITVPMNSLNLIQAREVSGNLGLTTFEFLLKENFMCAAVGEVLFRLHPRYTLGTSKLLVPVPQYEDTEVRKYGAYVATLLGCVEKSGVAFHVTMVTARGERVQVSLNGGDILVCTDAIQRSIPQTLRGTAFVSETFYYPPHLPAVAVEEKLRNDYFVESGGELERAADGSLVWRREKFACRAWV